MTGIGIAGVESMFPCLQNGSAAAVRDKQMERIPLQYRCGIGDVSDRKVGGVVDNIRIPGISLEKLVFKMNFYIPKTQEERKTGCF